MPYAGTAAITELWAKSVLAFGRSLGVSAASTTVDVQLKNNAGTVLSTGVIPAATTSSAGLMTAADKTTLDGLVVSGGEPNQNAWSSFVFGSTSVPSTAKTDTFTFTAGTGVTFSVNAANKAVEISATGTTYSDFTVATESAAGTHGLVPAPPMFVGGQYPRALLANGWQSLNLTTIRNSETGKLSIALESPSSNRFLGVSQELEVATTSLNGVMSAADKTKLDGMTAGAEPNQNAFGTVAYTDADSETGSIAAAAESDTLKLTAGRQIDFDANSSDGLTISYRPTVYHAACDTAAGTAAKVATLDNLNGFSLAVGVVVAVTFQYGNSASTPTLNVNSTGAKTVAIAKDATTYQTGNGTTYNSWGAYETVLFTYTGTYWAHIPSGRLGYLAYSGLSSKANTASPALTGTPTAPTAAAGTNTTQIATTAFVQQEIASASVGAASFQGTLSAQSTLTNADYKSGWYWVVGTAGTYAGQACEAGDMVFAVADKGSSYSASDFSVVQNNIVEMTAAEVDAICTL